MTPVELEMTETDGKHGEIDSIEPDDAGSVVELGLPQKATENQSPPVETSPSGSGHLEDIIDLNAARQLCGDKDERVRMLAETLLQEAKDLIIALQAAIEDKDIGTIRRHAHSLKGAAAGFGATDGVDAARGIESLSAEQRGDEIDASFSDLSGHVEKLVVALEQVIASR